MGEVSKYSILIFAVLLLAAQVTPEELTIQGGPGVEFSEVLTITNDQARPVQYVMSLSEYSQYLSDATSVQTETFALQPQQSKNVQVTGTVPQLGPEIHELVYEIREGTSTQATITLFMPIEGTPEFEPALSIDAADMGTAEVLNVDTKLSNFGNIIAYYDLELEVQEQGSTIGTLEYPRAIQVLPGEEQELTLSYTDVLEPGNYDVIVTANVNDQETLQERDSIVVTLNTESKEINTGEDLSITLKRYDTRPRVSYVVAQRGDIQLQEVFVAQEDSFEIPTSTLEAGNYQVQVEISTADTSETQNFSLEILQTQVLPSWLAPLLILIAVVSLLASKTTRRQIQLWKLQYQVSRREKRLNTLIHRAHRLEERL